MSTNKHENEISAYMYVCIPANVQSVNDDMKAICEYASHDQCMHVLQCARVLSGEACTQHGEGSLAMPTGEQSAEEALVEEKDG